MRTTAVILILVAIAASQPTEIVRALCVALTTILRSLGL
jgi:hypothetical protein